MLYLSVLSRLVFDWLHLHLSRLRSNHPRHLRRPKSEETPAPRTGWVSRPKPDWVRREVLRLKALMPDNGCRKIAATFNYLHQENRNMTVERTYVSNKIRDHQLEIERIRRDLKNRVPRRVPRNLVWALDLTYLPASGDAVLGVLDHGSRACLVLRKLTLRRSIDILRVVLDLVEAFGRPKMLRTDNEGIFTSRLFGIGLRLLGICHQRTAPFAPWQNGRIERFFGTFKERLRAWMSGFDVGHVTQTDLDLARAWYNGVRPHQHLDGQVPAEAWIGERRRSPEGRYFSAWNGSLTGFY